MSLQTWNSVAERGRLERHRRQVTRFLQYVVLRRNFQTDFDDISSSSSDSSDGSVSSDSTNGRLYSAAIQIARQYIEHYNHVYGRFQDGNIHFGQKKVIADFNDSECINDFRFRPEHLHELADALWPRLSPFLEGNREKIVVGHRYTAPFETCLLVYLFKMARPVRLRPECERHFGMRKSHISAIIQTFGHALYSLAEQYLTNPAIWHPYMEHFSELIAPKCNYLLNNIWGFIDATIRKTCRPLLFQELIYTRYKRCHGIKFQSIVNAEGFIACLFGPFPARRNDARIYRESLTRELLQEIMPADEANGPVYAVYGDLAYPQSIYLFGGFFAAVPGTAEAIFNQQMSSARIVVEWGFNNIVQKWSHLDFRRSMQIFKQPIAQQYVNCAFLTNISNCFYGNSTCKYFGQDLPSIGLHDYLGLIDNA
jgi:DDE superfamily endonuclease